MNIYTALDKPQTDIPQTDNNSHESANESETDSVVASLCKEGITATTATEIAQTFAPEEIRRQIEALPHRKANDPAAVLVKAIREKWTLPASLAAVRQKRQQAETRRQRSEQQAQAIQVERGRQETHKSQLQALWDGLPPFERETIEREAHARFKRENALLAAKLASNTKNPVANAALAAAREAILTARVSSDPISGTAMLLCEGAYQTGNAMGC